MSHLDQGNSYNLRGYKPLGNQSQSTTVIAVSTVIATIVLLVTLLGFLVLALLGFKMKRRTSSQLPNSQSQLQNRQYSK